jgi:predicted RNA binding protein YcfA (HicA-like mRNA interferase family)
VGKLRILSGREVIAILEEHGFKKARQRGSHVSMQRKNEEGRTVTTLAPLHSELSRATLRSIIRQSGLPRETFESE